MTKELIKISDGKVELSENEYLTELLAYRQKFQAIPTVGKIIDQVVETMHQLASGYLPKRIGQLEITDTMIHDVQQFVLMEYPVEPQKGNMLWLDLADALEELDYLLRHFRDALIETFSMYGYVSTPLIESLSKYLNGAPVLELMAGHGYLSAGLRALHPEQLIWATDNEDWRLQPDPTKAQPVTNVENLDAQLAVKKYAQEATYLLISWAPDTSETDLLVIDDALAINPLLKIIVIGEADGATNSNAFWKQAHLQAIPELNQQLTSFDLIDEQAYLLLDLDK